MDHEIVIFVDESAQTLSVSVNDDTPFIITYNRSCSISTCCELLEKLGYSTNIIYTIPQEILPDINTIEQEMERYSNDKV